MGDLPSKIKFPQKIGRNSRLAVSLLMQICDGLMKRLVTGINNGDGY